MICAVLRSVTQGDLFAEAPKPPVSEEKKVLNESIKSTAQTAGKIDKEVKIRWVQTYRKKKLGQQIAT